MKYFSNISNLIIYWRKQNIILKLLNFRKRVARMFIDLHVFSMHQIFSMKLSTLDFIERTKNAVAGSTE